MRKDYYGYFLCWPNGVPFYVGMGRGRRLLDHEMQAKRGHQSHKARIIRKILKTEMDLLKFKAVEGLSKAEAIEWEKKAIAAIGRRPNGSLVNMTDGGEGVLNLDVEALRRREESKLKSFSRKEVRAKMSASAIKDRARPERREQMRRSSLGALSRPETRIKMSNSQKARFAKSSEREKTSIGTRKAMASPEVREKVSKSQHKRFEDQNERLKMSISTTNSLMTIEARKERGRLISDGHKKSKEIRACHAI